MSTTRPVQADGLLASVQAARARADFSLHLSIATILLATLAFAILAATHPRRHDEYAPPHCARPFYGRQTPARYHRSASAQSLESLLSPVYELPTARTLWVRFDVDRQSQIRDCFGAHPLIHVRETSLKVGHRQKRGGLLP